MTEHHLGVRQRTRNVGDRDEGKNYGSNPQTSSLRVHARHFLMRIFALSATNAGAAVSDR